MAFKRPLISGYGLPQAICGVNGGNTLKRRTIFERKLQQAVAAMQFEFCADVRAMRLDGARADEKFRADFAARFFLGDQFEDAPFGLRQVVKAGFFCGKCFGTTATADEIAGNRGA